MVNVTVDTIVYDEMIDPVIDTILQEDGMTVYRAPPSEDDDQVLQLAQAHDAPILTRDQDFVTAHREGADHSGIIFDAGMHHRPINDIVAALTSVFDVMDAADLQNTVVRLNRFY